MKHTRILPANGPQIAVAEILATFARHDIEALTEGLIASLDALDGDPDLEEDDPSGQCDEDGINTGSGSFVMHGIIDSGAGCPIADPGGSDYGF